MERVGSGLEVERHHAAACNGALRIQAAGLRLHFFYGLHAWAAVHRIAANVGRARGAVDRVFLGKILASVDYRGVWVADRRVAGSNGDRKVFNKPPSLVDAQRQVSYQIALHVGALGCGFQIEHGGVAGDGNRGASGAHLEHSIDARHFGGVQGDAGTQKGLESVLLKLDRVGAWNQVGNDVNSVMVRDGFGGHIRACVGGGDCHVRHYRSG